MLLLVDDDADDDARDAREDSEEEEEEHFDAGHRTRLRVLHVVSRRFEVAGTRLDPGSVFGVGLSGLGKVELVKFHRQNVVVVGQVA